MLKNLEDIELIEIIVMFSNPFVDAFSANDAYAAFSLFKINKI